MDFANIKVVHEGRGGYVEYQGYKYYIELVGAGHFCIGFPSGNRHKYMQQHLDLLKEYAQSREPAWYVENRCRKYK
jgi:hypothetical protein